MEEIPKVKPVSPPSDDFIIIVDCDGDPQEVFSGNVNLNYVFETIDRLDRDSGYHPHSAWRRSAGGFTRVLRNIRVVLDPPRTHNGVDNPDPTDYLDFTVDFTSEFQYQFFYDLVKDRIVMIDRWEDGEDETG